MAILNDLGCFSDVTKYKYQNQTDPFMWITSWSVIDLNICTMVHLTNSLSHWLESRTGDAFVPIYRVHVRSELGYRLDTWANCHELALKYSTHHLLFTDSAKDEKRCRSMLLFHIAQPAEYTDKHHKYAPRITPGGRPYTTLHADRTSNTKKQTPLNKPPWQFSFSYWGLHYWSCKWLCWTQSCWKGHCLFTLPVCIEKFEITWF